MANIAYARRFNGTFQDHLLMLDGQAIGAYAGITVAAIIKSVDNTTNRTFCAVDGPEGFHLRVAPDEDLAFYNGSTDGYSGSSYVTAAMGWVLVAATKTTGTTTTRFHRYRYDTLGWNHVDDGGTQADAPTTDSTSEVRIGSENGASSWFEGDIAVVGLWRGTALSDGNIETLYSGIDAWEALSPSALWLLDQASVATAIVDRTGNGADEDVRTGTTAVAVADLSFSVGGDSPSLIGLLGVG